MNPRRASAWGWIAIFAALGVFAFLGNRILFVVWAALTVPFLVYHVRRVCARCTNISCGLNPRSPDFIFRLGSSRTPTDDLGYSDINPIFVSTLPLAALAVLALVGAWQYSPLATVALLACAAANMTIYERVSCRRCTNNCPNNRNPAYRRWKEQQAA